MSTRTASTNLVNVSIIDGYLVAVPNDPSNAQGVALANYLGSDIQTNDVGARELLDVLNKVKEGYEESFDGTGNLYTIYFDRDGAKIENCYFPEDLTIRLAHEDVRQGLEAVLAVLNHK